MNFSQMDRSTINSLEFLIRQSVGHRADIGLYAFALQNGQLNSSCNRFNYDECIAIAALLHDGHYWGDQAAALVAHDIVYASPHYVERGIESPGRSNKPGEGLVGIFRLGDGSLWAVHCDNDMRQTNPSDLERDFLLVATRGTTITCEPIGDRIRQLLTRCDELGCPILET